MTEETSSNSKLSSLTSRRSRMKCLTLLLVTWVVSVAAKGESEDEYEEDPYYYYNEDSNSLEYDDQNLEFEEYDR